MDFFRHRETEHAVVRKHINAVAARSPVTTEITFIDGDAGLLYYRGYPIEQLAENSDFLEVCYLLLEGQLPTAKQKIEFERKVTSHTMVHDQLVKFYNGFRRDAHPMAVMVGVVGALSAFYHDSLDINCRNIANWPR